MDNIAVISGGLLAHAASYTAWTATANGNSQNIRNKDEERIALELLSDRFTRFTLRFGYMENPNVPKELAACRPLGLKFDVMSTSFFLSRRSLRPSHQSVMPGWQDNLFIDLARSADDAARYFRNPSGRAVEVERRLRCDEVRTAPEIVEKLLNLRRACRQCSSS